MKEDVRDEQRRVGGYLLILIAIGVVLSIITYNVSPPKPAYNPDADVNACLRYKPSKTDDLATLNNGMATCRRALDYLNRLNKNRKR